MIIKHIRLQTDVDVNYVRVLVAYYKQHIALRIGNKPKEKRERSTWTLCERWGIESRSIPRKKPEYS